MFFNKKKRISGKTTNMKADMASTINKSEEKEDNKINPPEIMRLNNYFDTFIKPSYLFETDGDEDKTNINWVALKGYSIEKSINEFVSFKPHMSEYDHESLDIESSCVLWCLRNDRTFFIIDSPERLPKDKDTFENLKRICSDNAIGIVKLLSKGIYYEYVEEKYYRVAVDETWPGMADDAATYGAYHINQITEQEAKIEK